jgi:hypothetical protein
LRTDGLGRGAADPAQPTIDDGIQICRRGHLLHEPHRQRLGCRIYGARQQHLARATPADQTRQQCRLDHRRQAHVHLGHAELRGIGRGAEIAARRHLQPRTEAEAVDAAYDRQRTVADRCARLM